MATMLLMFGAVNAQIAEVKQEGGYARIYNEEGRWTGNSIQLGYGDVVSGYNSKYIVVTEGLLTGRYARIYNEKGRWTGNSISLSSTSYVIRVSETAILIKEFGKTRYYNFVGRYTGHSTD